MKQIASVLNGCQWFQNRIVNRGMLKNNTEYWYVSVTYNCFWIIKVHHFTYDGSQYIDGMILFDNETDANLCCSFIQGIANQLMIH